MSENLTNGALPFDMEAFIDGLAKDSKRDFQISERANKVLMNLKSNQGTITIAPIISPKIGNIYIKLDKVREFKGMTSHLDTDEPVWYKILPKEVYTDLNEVQSALYDEVTGLFDQVADYDALDYDELRYRRYSLFTGICLKHVNLDGQEIEENKNQPCLFIFPSTAPIDALNTAIAQKRSALGERTLEWLTKIITPKLIDRQGVLMITFKKPDSPGYQATINFETNNPADFIEVIDPKRDFSSEVEKFNDPVSSFIGWMNNQDNNSRFNEAIFRELRDQLKLTLKELSSEPADDKPQGTDIPNQNGSIDPMKSQMPPIPGVDSTQQEAPKTTRPF